jgi:hypothetical protein
MEELERKIAKLKNKIRCLQDEKDIIGGDGETGK